MSQNKQKEIKNQQLKTVAKTAQETVIAMIEIPKGCRNKYEYDKDQKIMKYDRMIHSSVRYPSDYGFIMDTLAQDGDSLDTLVLVSEPTFPGCVIEVKPVGVLDMWDDKGIDEKILCVPLYDPFWNHITELDQIQSHLLREIEHFFSTCKFLENKETGVDGWKDRKHALEIIKQAQDRFVKNLQKS